MTRRVGIIGHPVGHSLSPVFQQAAFDHCGLDLRYEAWDTPLAELPARVASLRSPDVLGANVTVPHKEAVIPHLDELGGQAARVGAVNTIVNRDGRLYGFNTDGPGFVAALRHEAHVEPAGRSFLLVGAGGAARGIAFALAEARASRILIWNRSPERAAALAGDVGYPARAVAELPPLDGFDCAINCTSLGMRGGHDPEAIAFPLEGAHPGLLVVDIVYAPAETPLLRRARELGLPTLGGLPMLIYQGALAFEHWTGLPAPVDVMDRAARNELARRYGATA
ncbi:shikimate dehydrogenase [Tepidiforma sp.]|uniref:shikimate dehydrogenase n=1 Tax=Tepidiforma sp. TaxID=2682230 RepID=UPI002ADE21EA|nr:shikimate dehydrogenase [Tepidiforma sp.]